MEGLVPYQHFPNEGPGPSTQYMRMWTDAQKVDVWNQLQPLQLPFLQ